MNVTGQEVATGVADPLIMFIVVGGLLGVGIIIFIAYSLIKLIGGN